jgi:hypothetical protein
MSSAPRMTAPEILGPFRSPRNISRTAGAGSIHDDATASKLGFKGGTSAVRSTWISSSRS